MPSKEFLINSLISKGIFNAPALVNGAINYAFDKKYFKYYSFEKDIHEYSDDWITDFHSILKKLNLSTKLNNLTMLNVGCNDGSQMKKLVGSNYKDLYLVDIGIRSLKLAKEIFPNSIIINTNADMLYGIPKNSIDLYLSFRTYNSSFFNIEGAISELNRVLCNNAAVIISIPNGFVDNNGNFISGLKPPKKNFIDETYPFKISGTIMFEISKYGFKDIGLLNSFYEIYIY